MTTPLSRRLVIGGLAALGPMAALAQAPTGPQVGKAPTAFKPPYPVQGKVQRLDPGLDALIAPDAQIEEVCDGFVHAEGPVWVGGADGYLLFSDTRANAIFKWSPAGGRQVWVQPSGYDHGVGWDASLGEPGTNGLIAARGGIVAADAGNRAISFFDLKTKKKTALVSNFEGKRLNTPNDAVLGPDGSIYFDDPPYGFSNRNMSPLRDLDYSGIYRLSPDNKLTLLEKTLMPNGIALSPDGKTLYVTDGTPGDGGGWLKYDLDPKGGLSNKRVFIRRTATMTYGDGMKVDSAGHLWAATGDGISIFDLEGKRIGLISTDEGISNCEFGGDGYLYLTNSSKICRVKVKATKIARKVS